MPARTSLIQRVEKRPHRLVGPRRSSASPRRALCDLHSILWHFLHFRLEVVTRRLEHELEGLRARIHALEGFEKVFDTSSVPDAFWRYLLIEPDAGCDERHRSPHGR